MALSFALMLQSACAPREHQHVARKSGPKAPHTASAARKIKNDPALLQPPARAPSSSKFAIVDLYAAASSGLEGITYEGFVVMRSIETVCEDPIRFSQVRSVEAPPSKTDEPAVAVMRNTVCVPVSSQTPPMELIGKPVRMRRTRALDEFLNGEEFSSPDPEDLLSAGASLYIPDVNGGRLVGVFALAGTLEVEDRRQYNAAVSTAVNFTARSFEEHRLLLTLRSPLNTPVNVSVPAPVLGVNDQQSEADEVSPKEATLEEALDKPADEVAEIEEPISTPAEPSEQN